MMCDFSAAIIAACLKIYNNQTRTEYLDMLYDAIVTKSKELDAVNTMILLVCVTHIMKTNGRSIDRLLEKRRKTEDIKSIRHLAMRVVSLLANCETSEQVERIVKHTAIVFKSEIVSDPMRTSLKFLEESINTFQIPDEDFQQICNEGLENDEQSHMVGKLSKFRSHFEKIVNSLAINEGEVRTEANKYFFPTFLDYLLQELLPSIPMWSGIIRPIIMASEEKISKLLNKRIRRTFRDFSTTNAYAENYFKFVKSIITDKNLALDEFIESHWSEIKGLFRQYYDGIRINVHAKVTTEGYRH